MSKQKEKEFPLIRCNDDKSWAAAKAMPELLGMRLPLAARTSLLPLP